MWRDGVRIDFEFQAIGCIVDSGVGEKKVSHFLLRSSDTYTVGGHCG